MYAILGRLFVVVWLIGVGAKLKECQDKGEWPYGPLKPFDYYKWTGSKSASDEASPSPASASDSIDKEKPNV